MEVQDVIAQARDTMTVKRVFGEPYEKDGVTIIPAARVQGGAGGGSGDDPTARPALDHGLIERFSPVDDADYDDIRAMLAVIEAARWTSLTQAAVAPEPNAGNRPPARVNWPWT